MAPAVGGLHHARAASGDDGVAGARQPRPHLHGHPVGGILGLGAGRAEDADGRPQLRQGPEALDELRLDAHDPPRVGVEPVGVGVTAQQSRVGGLGGDLGAAQHHWSLAVGLT